MVFGDERNYCVALVTLDPDAMAGWATENGMEGASYTEIVKSDAVQTMVERLRRPAQRASSTAGRPSRSGGCSTTTSRVESGEMTPSMKVKRNVVQNNHQELIDAMYA